MEYICPNLLSTDQEFHSNDLAKYTAFQITQSFSLYPTRPSSLFSSSMSKHMPFQNVVLYKHSCRHSRMLFNAFALTHNGLHLAVFYLSGSLSSSQDVQKEFQITISMVSSKWVLQTRLVYEFFLLCEIFSSKTLCFQLRMFLLHTINGIETQPLEWLVVISGFDLFLAKKNLFHPMPQSTHWNEELCFSIELIILMASTFFCFLTELYALCCNLWGLT